MDNNYDELEKQIGDMGGDQRESKSMGKLKHKSAYGQKEDLTEEEKASMANFLNKTSKMKREQEAEAKISDGWIPLDRAEMGMRSMFYPDSWEFYIRPATMNAIKNWTAVDEESPAQVNKVFNDIIKTCVKIETKDVNKASWNQINSWDKFWFTLKIREYTFPNNENVVFTDVCSECGEEMEYVLKAESLYYSFPDDDLIENYYTLNHWEIDPREYDVDHDVVKLYIPKLAKDEAIIEWATNRVRNDQQLDEPFIKYLVWLLDKPSSDSQMLDRQIQKIYNEYKSWDLNMFNFMTDVINNISINPSEKLKSICPSCSREATSNVQFPNGIKVLFAAKTTNKKFGSR